MPLPVNTNLLETALEAPDHVSGDLAVEGY
jgi:hypothetical protein